MQDHVKPPFQKWLSNITFKTILKIGLTLFYTYSMAGHADYKKIVDVDFWEKVYPTGGKTFFCQTAFEKNSPILTVGHVYPTALITKEFNCRSERSCLRSNPRFGEILSDLHNMVPVNSFYHFKLKDSTFGNLEESNEPNECGIKKRYHIIEPPDNIKGDIARIHFYMHKQYNLPLSSNFTFLKSWDKKDPVSKEELDKNERIKNIQGNGNMFVTDPSLADQLNF